MTKVHLPINISFLIILISVLILAIIEGGSISNSILGRPGISGGNEIQQIAFIILTLIILITATLHPDKMYLSAYSSMTLGLIVIIGSFYGIYTGQNGLNILQFFIGIILILSGVLLFKYTKLNKEEKSIVYEGIKYYKK